MRIFRTPTRLVNVINSMLALGGVTGACLLRDPHFLQRFGAAIAAMTGLFVVWQVRDELMMDRRLTRLSFRRVRRPETVIAVKAEELQAVRRKRAEAELRAERMALVGVIALWLFVGEVLHGFGDIIVQLLFSLFGSPAAVTH